jgi:hypothetical protein
LFANSLNSVNPLPINKRGNPEPSLYIQNDVSLISLKDEMYIQKGVESGKRVSLKEDEGTVQTTKKVAYFSHFCDENRSSKQAMVEPIRRSLEYQAVGRKLLLVDKPL